MSIPGKLFWCDLLHFEGKWVSPKIWRVTWGLRGIMSRLSPATPNFLKWKLSVGVLAGLSNLFDDSVSEPLGILLRRLQLFLKFFLVIILLVFTSVGFYIYLVGLNLVLQPFSRFLVPVFLVRQISALWPDNFFCFLSFSNPPTPRFIWLEWVQVCFGLVRSKAGRSAVGDVVAQKPFDFLGNLFLLFANRLCWIQCVPIVGLHGSWTSQPKEGR